MVQQVPQTWSIVREDKEYDTPVFNLYKRRSKHPSGLEGTFYVVDTPDWVNIVAINNSDEIILIDQFRHGMEKITTEIPGGMIDPGESALKAAQRELREETGLASTQWSQIGMVEANPAIMKNRTYTFLALRCEQVQEPEPDPHEEIRVHHYPADQIFELVDDGTIRHSLVVAALTHYQRWMEQGENAQE
jgi:8-oxo-dGTP pyrophosphatase MutT (NUDIX family)